MASSHPITPQPSPQPNAQTPVLPTAGQIILPAGQTTLPPGQPVYVIQQPVAGAVTTDPTAAPPHGQAAMSHTEAEAVDEQQLLLYSHSNLFYWWPVWMVGYIMAAVTRFDGQLVSIGDQQYWFHPSKNLGVIFTLTFFMVILVTSMTLRGLASVVAILSIAFFSLLLAYFHLWETVLNWLGELAIMMNLGFYLFFSTIIFGVWVYSVFVYDRMVYWKIRPGQITQERVIGGAEKSYDARGIVFEKHREDLFRHWVLGIGSGDVQFSTTGAKRETVYIPNVLFVNSKIDAIQRMLAIQPDKFTGGTA
jgi:hypothetical protein